MPVDEAIYIKEKPKRKLTQAQLDGLAKGRAKVKEKRDLSKADTKIQKENNKNYKENRGKRNRTIAEQRELEIKVRLEASHQKKIDLFNEIKYEYMDKCKTMGEMREMKEILDTIDEDEIYDLKAVGMKILKEVKKKYNNNLNKNEAEKSVQSADEEDEDEDEEPERRGREYGHGWDE